MIFRSQAGPLLLILCLLPSACSRPTVDEHEEHPEHAEEGHAAEHEEGVVELHPEVLARLDIRTEPVAVRVLPDELETTGQVDFEQDRLAHVTPRIPGRVAEVRADLGDEVRKDQVLALIDSIDLGQAKASYLQSRAQAELARQNFEREEGLHRERISSEKEMLAARAAHAEAQARLRSAEETLRLYGVAGDQIQSLSYEDGRASFLPVRAPLAGRVVEKHVTMGELVTPERTMFTIADLRHVWIWIDVYERDLRHVHLEDDVEVEVAAFPQERFGGKVSYLSDQVDADTRTVRARIDVANPTRKLRPGMFVHIRVTDPHAQPGADAPEPSLVIPESAIQREGSAFIVFVVRGAGRFERREVVPGRKAGGFVEIRSGLGATDNVVVAGTFLLKSEASKEQMGAGHEH